MQARTALTQVVTAWNDNNAGCTLRVAISTLKLAFIVPENTEHINVIFLYHLVHKNST